MRAAEESSRGEQQGRMTKEGSGGEQRRQNTHLLCCPTEFLPYLCLLATLILQRGERCQTPIFTSIESEKMPYGDGASCSTTTPCYTTSSTNKNSHAILQSTT
jgi:hypothetical protein